MRPMGIYIHIPFCKQKCNYCDFFSFAGKEDKMQEYQTVLKEELKSVGKQNREDAKIGKDEAFEIKTIYIGGGTPSYLKEGSIKEIVETVKENFCISSNAEITIEINPGTVTKEKLEEYRKVGINRISMGLQACQEHVLKTIGRIHDYEAFANAYRLAREIGFDNINVDLMIGLPKQNLSDVEKSVEQLIRLNPEHISVYSLIIEENTPMDIAIQNGELVLPKEELERKEYWTVKQMLESAGYIHYEISNFAKQGKESCHNVDCWNQKEYLGFGAGAHSYTDKVRYSNLSNFESYLQNGAKQKWEDNFIFHEKQTIDAEQKEFMMLGLRKIEGVSITAFKEKFMQNPIYLYRMELDKLVKEGLVEVEEDYIKLTSKGIDLANLVWEEFV